MVQDLQSSERGGKFRSIYAVIATSSQPVFFQMSTIMIRNLILIHVLSIIWSNGQVTSVETPVNVSEDVYETISRQLTNHQPTVTGEEGAWRKYEFYNGGKFSGE